MASRLAMVQTEAIHGLLVGNATIYNSPIGQACSWDPQLIHDMAVAIAKESAPLGINQLFAPLADLARELRFGRVEETYGEDGFLAGEMAYEYVMGVQSLNVSATVKHFAGFSNPEQGLNTLTTGYLRSPMAICKRRSSVKSGATSTG